MTNHRIIDFKTGRPVEETPFVVGSVYETIIHQNREAAQAELPKELEPPKENREDVFDQLCQSTGTMLEHTLHSLDVIIHLAKHDANAARSLKWVKENGMTLTVPYALRVFRIRLDWLEEFYKRNKK